MKSVLALFYISSTLSLTRKASRSVSRSMSLKVKDNESSVLAFDELTKKLSEIEKLSGIKNLLDWDEMVLMKSGSVAARGDHKTSLSGIIYEKQTSPELKNLIDSVNQSGKSHLTNDFERAILRDAERDYNLVSRKSRDMVLRETELEGKGYQTWTKARENKSFKEFASVFTDIVNIKKEIAGAISPNQSPYNANIDLFERGMTHERLHNIFTSIKPNIISLIQQIQSSSCSSTYIPPSELQGSELWNINTQKELCIEIAKSIGFDFEKGRLDVSVHPFTGGPHPTDVRITTRYSSSNWLEGIAGTVHEVGHALYEQGRNMNYNNLPVSRPLSMGVHESQSLFWERMIFQSYEFWTWCTPIVHKHFPHTQSITVDQFYRHVNNVSPGFIRVDADEVTYPLHIILRFELEKALFEGSIEVNDLPTVWKERMRESLGLEVENDAQGILQDIHWSIGALGYFPSYTLGAMIAAQLFEKIETEIPNIRTLIATGEFSEIREWLRKNIHEIGSLYDSPDKLLEVVTEKPLDPSIFMNYLDLKYKKLYDLRN